MIPFQPIARETPGVARQYLIGRNLFMAAAIVMAVLACAMILFGLLLAGGRVGPIGDPAWGVVVPWPVIPIPAWLVILVCCIPPVASLLMVPRVTSNKTVELNYLLMLTVILFIAIPFVFARMYPVDGGPVFDDAHPEFGLANHWWGAVPQVITVVALIAGMIRAGALQRREQRAGAVA